MSKNIAEVTSKYGDPESFAERELTIDGAALQKLPIGTKLYAQLVKAPEPWGYAFSYATGSGEERQIHWELCAKDDAEVLLYTFPPEVAELQKQVQVLQAEISDFKDIWLDDARLYASLLKLQLPRNMLLALALAIDHDDIKADNTKLQAKIDSLMLEFCPDRMTEEQKDNWADHQKAVKS